MLKLIIEKEIRDIIKSSKFVYMFAICAVLIILTFYVGGKNYRINRSQYEAAVEENKRTIESQVAQSSIAPNIFLPPQPVMSLVSGISNDIGRDIQIATIGDLSATESKYNEDPIYAVFRFLDLDFLFQMILALFAILCTYNAINGEKEGGTLALTFSNSVPRHKYILGKIIGSFCSVTVALLIPILIGCLLLPILGVPMAGGDWLKLFMILFTGFLYFSVFLILSIASLNC